MDRAVVHREYLADLVAERDKTKARLESLEAAISLHKEITTKSFDKRSAPAASPVKKPPARPLGSMSLIDGAVEVLREAGEPLHMSTIVARMQERGLAKNRTLESVRQSITGTLNKKPNIHRPEPGTYAYVNGGSAANAS